MIRTGIIGYPLTVTLSPAMHNAAFLAGGLTGHYEPIAVPPEGIRQKIADLQSAGYRGLNVTIPHKETVLEVLTEVHEPARSVGAVNTILFDRGQRIGYNTDIPGFITALAAENIRVEGQNVLLIGAGGAARAYAWALRSLQPCRLWIANRTDERALQLAKLYAAEFVAYSAIDRILPACNLVVNATAIDLQADLLPRLPAGSVYYDANYKFPLQKYASVRVVNGLLMLIWQGAYAFEIWTGHKPPLDVMKAAVGLM